MNKRLNFFTPLHNKTKRNYLERMIDNKSACMIVAKKYGKHYWDGNRKYGYGGYKYIQGRWTNFAKKIIKKYKLNSKSKILDIGCGKGFLLYEIKKQIKDISIKGIDVSSYAIKNSKIEIKEYLKRADITKKNNFKNKEFDLVICLGVLHNFSIEEISFVFKQINRISKRSFIMMESYRNEKELFNLQCWALTCTSFLQPSDWNYLFKINNFKGDYELIYFK